jgi:hypothetical protein
MRFKGSFKSIDAFFARFPSLSYESWSLVKSDVKIL